MQLAIDPLDPLQHSEGLVNIISGSGLTDPQTNVNNATYIGTEQLKEFKTELPNSFHSTLLHKITTMGCNKRHLKVGYSLVFDTQTIYARAVDLQSSSWGSKKIKKIKKAYRSSFHWWVCCIVVSLLAQGTNNDRLLQGCTLIKTHLKWDVLSIWQVPLIYHVPKLCHGPLTIPLNFQVLCIKHHGFDQVWISTGCKQDVHIECKYTTASTIVNL